MSEICPAAEENFSHVENKFLCREKFSSHSREFFLQPDENSKGTGERQMQVRITNCKCNNPVTVRLPAAQVPRMGIWGAVCFLSVY
jgi:hypothetical protein